MKKQEDMQVDMTKLYQKLDELISHLSIEKQNSIKLNVDVPAQQSISFSINVKNRQKTEYEVKQNRQESIQTANKSKEQQEQTFYQVNIREKQKIEPSPLQFSFKSPHPQDTAVQTFPPSFFSDSPSLAESAVQMRHSPSYFREEEKNTKIQTISRPGLASYIKKQETTQTKIPKTTEVNLVEVKKQSTRTFREKLAEHSEVLLNNLDSNYKSITEKDRQSLSASRKMAIQYSNRLQRLNQKLRKKINVIAPVTVKKRKTDSHSLSQSRKDMISPQKVSKDRSSRVNIKQNLNCTECCCEGHRPCRKKRSISPYFNFNTYDYKYVPGSQNYRPYSSPKKQLKKVKQQSPNKKQSTSVQKSALIREPSIPTNCRNVLSKKEMSNFLQEVQNKYKTRRSTEKINFETLDTNKKYTAHKLAKSPVKKTIPQKSKSSSYSLLPHKGCFHRCIVCCNQS